MGKHDFPFCIGPRAVGLGRTPLAFHAFNAKRRVVFDQPAFFPPGKQH
ncbi:hypothetical protein J7444_05365 [Labrenzia sp. R4_1]|nr:hypothetical protein [Labrenzia sp. R4_1]MBO9424137.1 hypothetical protein [Labrenzia sp. R4_1]